MSKNNLQAQLAWLLETNPFIPPESSIQPAVAGKQSTITATETETEEDSNLLQQVNDESLERPKSVEPLSGKVQFSHENTISNTSNMAKLRAGPSPTRKPRLVAQNSCPNPETPSSDKAAVSRRVQSDWFSKNVPPVQNIHADPCEVNLQPSISKGSAKTIFRTPRADIEQIDLTGNSQEKPFAKNNDTIQAGRKRKSAEYEGDIRQSSSPRRPCRVSQDILRESQDESEFFNIDDAMEIAPDILKDDPPPPYSSKPPEMESRNEGSRGYSRYYSSEESDHDGRRRSEFLGSPGDAADRDIPPRTYPHFSPSNGPAPGSGPSFDRDRSKTPAAASQRVSPQKVQGTPVVQVKQSSPRKMQGVSAKAIESREYSSNYCSSAKSTRYDKTNATSDEAVPDSEAEEDIADDPVNDTGSGGKRDRSANAHDRFVDSESPSKSKSFARPPNNLYPQTTTSPTKLKYQHKDTTMSARTAEPSAINVPMSSMLNSDTDKIQNIAMKDSNSLITALSKWSKKDFEEQLKLTIQNSEDIEEEVVDAVGQDLDVTALGVKLQQARARVDALDSLMNTLPNHEELVYARIRSREPVMKAIKNKSIPDSSDKERFQQATSQWLESEKKLVALIKTSELDVNSPADTREPHDTAQRIAVQSTQVPLRNEVEPETFMPDSTFVQTQLVKQTQPPNRSELSPVKDPLATRNQATTSHNEKHTRTRMSPPKKDPPNNELNDIRSFMGMPQAQDFEDEDFDDGEDLIREMDEMTHGTNTHRKVFKEITNVSSRGPTSIKNQNDSPKHDKTSSQTGAASKMRYKWSADVKRVLREVFKLQGFRHHQLDAINTTLSGKDCFVLMPTGGGKSLCYQLPSVVQSGNTRGVTIVISPLLSLMEDQVTQLQKLNVKAHVLNGETDKETRKLILSGLRKQSPEQFVQLLYITPEMINKSQAILNCLHSLHERQMLARIVIDEAHCVSQWGHDFRPDYKDLGQVRQDFPGVPVMALTATATENVRVDVEHNLGLRNCQVFSQSFNRPNLSYEVIPKEKGFDLLGHIANVITAEFRNKSGIIYCLSRKQCEQVAEKLRENHKIKAAHYHAGLPPEEKRNIQRKWQAGVHHVIVATIAFGMGIDKADVRFVMHHSLPKSLEGYYQETGRAGRDGKHSSCYLYYGYQDSAVLKRMIQEGEGGKQQKDRQLDLLRNMVTFCENKSDCRRVQILAYFGERFDKSECEGQCDNCNSTSFFESCDLTDIAASAIRIVDQLSEEKPTILQCTDILKGSKSKKVTRPGHDALDEWGDGASLDRTDIERLFYRLVCESALETHQEMKGKFPHPCVSLGKKAEEFKRKRRRVTIQIRVTSPRGEKTVDAIGGTGVAKKRGGKRLQQPLSTNVSSPVHPSTRRKALRQVQDEDDSDGFIVPDGNDPEATDSEEVDDFEKIREPGASQKHFSKGQLFSEPIKKDSMLDDLDPVHQQIVKEFVQEAKKECKKIRLSKGLQRTPITETILRNMATTFPQDETQLRELGISQEKVDSYGKRFLKMVRKYQLKYEQRQARGFYRDHAVPIDRNREIVDLCSDVDEEGDSITRDDDVQDREESDYSDVDLNNLPSSQDVVRSTHFKKYAHDEQSNAQLQEENQPQTSKGLDLWGQLQGRERHQSLTSDDGYDPAPVSKAMARKSRGRRSSPIPSNEAARKKGSGSGSWKGKYNPYRKKGYARKSGTSRGGAGSGVRKIYSSRGGTNGRRGGIGGGSASTTGNDRGGGGTGVGIGIGMMPT